MAKQTGGKVPQIRFKGFDGEWECKKLGDLTETGFTNGVFNDPSKVGRGYRLINVKDMFSGSSIDVDNLSLVDIDENEFKRNRVRYGDIFFTRSSLVKEGIACSNVNLSSHQDITFDGHLIRMQPCRNITDSIFLSYAFKTGSSRRQFILGGKTTTMTTIGQSDIAVVEVALPTKTEQTQIGAYFRELDSLIGLHQRKHDKLVTLKKAMLQKMFPQPGATTPEIRFKGFEGDWVEKKLGAVGAFNPKEELPEIFEYVDLESVVGTEMVSYRTETRKTAPSRAQRLARQGDLFFQTVRPYQKNNYLFTLPFTNYVFSTGYAQIRPFNDGSFLLGLMQRDQFVKVVLDHCTGTSYPAINANVLAEIVVMIPLPEEQQKIGTYFRTLDTLISKHAIQLQKLQQIKSACLEKMFV